MLFFVFTEKNKKNYYRIWVYEHNGRHPQLSLSGRKRTTANDCVNWRRLYRDRGGEVYMMTGEVYMMTGKVYMMTGKVYMMTGEVYIMTGEIHMMTG